MSKKVLSRNVQDVFENGSGIPEHIHDYHGRRQPDEKVECYWDENKFGIL